MKRNIPITVISLAALAIVGCAGNGPGNGFANKYEQQNELKGNDLFQADPDLSVPDNYEGGNGKELGKKKLFRVDSKLKELDNTEAEQFPVAERSAAIEDGSGGKVLKDSLIKSITIAFSGEGDFYINNEYKFNALIELEDGSLAKESEVKWSLQGAIGHIDANGVFSAMAPGHGRIIAEVKAGKKWLSAWYDLRVMTKKKDLLGNVNDGGTSR